MRIEGGPATKRRPLRALLAVLLVVVGIGFVGLAAIVGLSAGFHWIVTYLVPVGVLLTPLLGAFWLLARTMNKIPPPPFRDRMQ